MSDEHHPVGEAVESMGAGETPTPTEPPTTPSGGHPQGLWVLFITEMWERFSYYGMRALLVLYLIASTTEATKNPGFGWTEDAAYKLYGIYTWAVYLTPIFGGLLADRFLGTHRSMVLGGWIIAAGHITLALTELFGYTAGEAVTMQTGPGALLCFMAGLGLIVIGTGFFKPCVSVMVGQLYGENDPRRDSGFTIFYMGINLGALLSPLVAGTLGEKVGWHWGFGAAAVGMILGLIFYQLFRPRYLRGIGLPPHHKAAHEEGREPTEADIKKAEKDEWEMKRPLTSVDFQRLGVIIVLAFLGNIFFWTAFEQAGTTMNVFAKTNTDRTLAGLFENDNLVQTIDVGIEAQAGEEFAIAFDGQRTPDFTIGTTTPQEITGAIGSFPTFEAFESTIETTNAEGFDGAIERGDKIRLTFEDARPIVLPEADDASDARGPPLSIVPPADGEDASDVVSTTLVKGGGFPATWYQSVNPLAILLFAPVFAWLWVFLDRRRLNPSTPMKFAWGLWLLGLGFLAMVFGSLEAREGLAGPHWLLITYVVYTWGELCLSPVGLSMVTKLAPVRLQSMMMGLWFFTFSLANLLAGFVVAPYSTKLREGEAQFLIPGLPGFYLMLVVFPIGMGVIIALITPLLKKMMHGVK